MIVRPPFVSPMCNYKPWQCICIVWESSEHDKCDDALSICVIISCYNVSVLGDSQVDITSVMTRYLMLTITDIPEHYNYNMLINNIKIYHIKWLKKHCFHKYV